MTVLDKKLFRTYLRTWGQVLAVVMVVVCGTACYIAFSTALRNLNLTRHTYFTRYRLADFEIRVERAPVTALFKLEEIPGVRETRPRIVQDVKAEIKGQEDSRILRLISMPNKEQSVLNGIHILQGRYFEEGAQDEVILSDRFAEENHLDVGDRIAITLNNKKHSLRIVARAQSPEYVYMIRNAQNIVPSPERFGILWVSQRYAETALDMNGACNSIVGSVESYDDLDAILDKAEKILGPYGVFSKVKKENQISYSFLDDEITGLGVAVKTIPPIFMGISSLILLIMLNRMVRNERTQIGLLKAYGYSNAAIAAHYFKFGIILCTAGACGGIALGQYLGNAMTKLYAEFYQFPFLRSKMYPEVIFSAVGIAVIAGLVGALVAGQRAARIQPAESMRPPAPKSGKRIWLERMTGLWRHMSFTWKMVARNMARSPFRAGLNVLGITLSSAILIVGFFTSDSFTYMIDFQYEQVQREDMKISFEIERGKGALYELSRIDHVRKAEPILQYPFEMKSAWHKKDVLIMGLSRNSRLLRVLDDQERVTDIGNHGLVMPERLARTLAVGVGDTVLLKPLMGRITGEKHVRVTQVVPQFFGMYAYMNIDALSRVLDEPMAMNAALVKTEKGTAQEVIKTLKDVPGVASVELKSDTRASIDKTLAQSMWIINVMLIGFSGVIAFAIIYNVTLVSLAERERELASLRVLGFHTHEVGRILYNENFMLTLVGLGFGIPLGMLLGKLLVKVYDTDLYRMPFHLENRTFVLCIVLTVSFVLLANLAVRRRIRKINLVEALKAPE